MADTQNIDIKYVAKLANLPLTDEEEKIFAPQLSKILDYFSVLKKVDTSQVLPTSRVNDLKNVTRKDEITKSLKLDTDYFKVKAIFDND